MSTCPPPLTLPALRHHLAALGAGPQHELRVLRDWVQCRDPAAARRKPEHFLPQALRQGYVAL